MRHIIIIISFALTWTSAFSHEGEEHGASKPSATGAVKYFSSEALSDKYEVLVKYGEIEAGKESVLQLFLSDAKTNKALDSATISIKIAGHPNLNFAASRADTGLFQLKGIFPQTAAYDLQVSISGPKGADFLQIQKIEVGKKLGVATDEAPTLWYSSPWLWAVAGLVVGIIGMYFLMRSRNRKFAAFLIVLFLLVPTAGINPSNAHDGESHGAEGAKSGGLSTAFLVEKESQFLFDILTQQTGSDKLYQSQELLGTVTASPEGLAVIQTPQTGKIVSLRVGPGQAVTKGQTLVVIEQQVDAATQLNIVSQRNQLNAEVKAAKVQYERLLTIADIAAKKDLTEAKARYEAAVENLQLFNGNIGGGSTKRIALTAPIGGIVGTFNYSIGAVVSAGQTLFEIMNLSRVYIETQVFSSTSANESKGSRFVAFAVNDTSTYPLKMISRAQSVNAENQSQRVSFEVINPNGKFKIGENVRVLQYGTNRVTQLVVPSSAIVDVNGKPAVFMKDKAEQFSIAFIQKGEANALYTNILKGAEEGERIVTGNVYQMKMIYLGQ
jgi:membrane fusion protein, heavy metal efflux system